MSNMPDNRPAYQGKQLTPNPDSQQSQGRETSRRSGAGDPALLRWNEPAIPADKKLGSNKGVNR